LFPSSFVSTVIFRTFYFFVGFVDRSSTRSGTAYTAAPALSVLWMATAVRSHGSKRHAPCSTVPPSVMMWPQCKDHK
jgi:hypothetical protein